ncbi:MEMAR_RS02690 family S-layer glycoprotein, partial [Methanoculleus sp. MH98A]|uniref:MEMAR_RS02690 family S-layer glycoprotein n=1 Tax=Methanoculleus sp. MH98A TaxID=1495314 RepID=UPI00049F7AFC
ALVIAPAAARTIEDTGSTIYVGEENLNLNALFGYPAEDDDLVGYLAHFSGNINDRNVVGTPIKVSNARNFALTEEAVGGSTGIWYAFTNLANITDHNGDWNGTVFVQEPAANLRVLLGDSGTTSVDGQSVTRANSIRFQIDHNLAGLNGSEYGTMQVRVTLPGGGTVSALGDSGELNLELTGQRVNTTPISLAGLGLGTYTARAVWPSNSADLTDSNAVTFEIVSGTVAITSNKDTVVRGNSFTVTITGESETDYWLNVTTAGDDLPTIKPNQIGVEVDENDNSSATVKTTAGGTRSVEFSTGTSTEARTYTIEVEGPIEDGVKADNSKTDSVKVRVEEGTVTVVASGTGTYYVGEEITLSGTCTDNETVFLYMTGPNLGAGGVNLEDLDPVENNLPGTFTEVDVEADDTWSYDWTTGNLGALESGGYTIYAVAEPKDRNSLSGVKYATTSVQLRPGFVTATVSGATVAAGDDVVITGTAQGSADDVRIWIFGKNFYGEVGSSTVVVNEPSVEDDGTFEHTIDNTDSLSSGQYFVIVQHPMTGGYGVGTDGTYLTGSGIPDDNVNLKNMPASEAANAVINALDSAYVDDRYTKLTFYIEDAWIFIDAIGDKAAGSTFTITGTTNLATGDQLMVEVTSAAFQPTAAGETSAFSSDSGTVEVQEGDGVNTWSFEVDASSFKPDQYMVTVESIETQTSTSANFNVVEAVPTTQTTPVETTPVETTPVETATTEATPTQSPGFGALLALAGLGAVAFLVLRRD